MSKKVLIIGGNQGSSPRCLEILRTMDIELDLVPNPLGAYPRLWRGGYDAIIAELSPEPGQQQECLKVLWQAKRNKPDIGIVMMAENCTEVLAQSAQEIGAAFLLKMDMPRELLEQTLVSLGLSQRGNRDDGPSKSQIPTPEGGSRWL